MRNEENAELLTLIETEMAKAQLDTERLVEQVEPVAPDNAIGRLTRMEALNSKAIQEKNLKQAKARLRGLEMARKRLSEDPDYGMCQQCEEPIPFKRLLLMPASTSCVACAERRRR